MPGRSHIYKKGALFLILILGLFLRINAVLETEVPNPLRADAGLYFSYAYNLRHFGSYSQDHTWINPAQPANPKPDAMASPGYPIFLLPFSGSSPTILTVIWITLVQALIGALLPLLVYILGARIVPGLWPLLPAFLTAISPQLIVSNTYALTETLFTFLLLSGITLLVMAISTPAKLWKIFVAGLVIGFGALTRPTLSYYWIALLIPIWLQTKKPVKVRLQITAALLAGCLLAYAPWTVRNLTTLGYASDPTIANNTLIYGSYPNYSYEGRPESRGYPYRFDPHIDRFGHSAADALAEIWRRASSEPRLYLAWYLLGKPSSYLGWGDAAAADNIFTYPPSKSPYFTRRLFVLTFMAMHFTHWIWVIAAIAGMAFSVVRFKMRQLASEPFFVQSVLSITVIYFVAIHMAGFPIARYNIPILPLLFLLATAALAVVVTHNNRGVVDH